MNKPPHPESSTRKIFRVELRIGKGDAEAILALYSRILEPDTSCRGNLIFLPEMPLRYRYAEGIVFVAEKMSVGSDNIAGWQHGVLLDSPPSAEVSLEPEATTQSIPEPNIEEEVPPYSKVKASKPRTRPKLSKT